MATPFTPKNNPAFILHGKLKTSYETVRNSDAIMYMC